MKAKILLIPLLIVIAVSVFIGLVYPQYSNGANGIKENYAKLKNEQIKLADLQKKNKNIDDLSTQIASFADKSLLYSFIPQNIKEEEIISSLNGLASSSGLLLFEATISSQSKSENIISDDLEMNAGGELPLTEVSKTAPKAKNLETEIKLLGNYEKVKNFLISLERLNRNNNLGQLKIDRNKNEAGVLDDNLLVSASVEFNFFKKMPINNMNAGDSIFLNNKLETAVVDAIKNQKNSNSFQVNVEQKGKSNIFLP